MNDIMNKENISQLILLYACFGHLHSRCLREVILVHACKRRSEGMWYDLTFADDDDEEEKRRGGGFPKQVYPV